VSELLTAATARLAAAGVPEPRRDAELLLAHVMGVDRWHLRLHGAADVPADAAAHFQALIDGRAARRPVSRLLGHREFWSLDFAIDDGVLDPRPDSETLVEAALGVVDDRAAPLTILDLGVGSGCLLLALLHELPAATGLGIDRSEAAIHTARANAAQLDLADRARFAVADWAAPLAAGRFDLVVTNPPYIPHGEIAGLAPEVAGGDPIAALNGGHDGLDAYRALAPQFARLLAPGGHVVLEHGAGQADAVAMVLGEAGLDIAAQRHDLAGRQRCLMATVPDRAAIVVKNALGMRRHCG
jgi:release factor glutamine methyltransferase